MMADTEQTQPNNGSLWQGLDLSGVTVAVGAGSGRLLASLAQEIADAGGTALPIEACPWGPLGEGLMVIPCLFVQQRWTGGGLGRALLDAAEEETRRQGRGGIVAEAFHHDSWFMPASFFERHGYVEVHRRGTAALLWKPFTPTIAPPRPLEPRYVFEPVPGKVAVDLFWQTFCETSWIEAQRVREVSAEFGDAVALREYPVDDRAVLLRHQIPRAIYVNGRQIDWGYEAPREGIREAISRALEAQE